VLEDVIGCEYNCSKEDLDWINENIATCPELNPDEFEKTIYLMDVFGDEKVLVNQPCPSPPTLEQVKEFFSESNYTPSDGLLKIVYDYWIDQRYTRSKGRLRFILKGEEMSDKPDSDPYVCFRRREFKNLRKGRRGDMLALEKLKSLKDDMLRVKEILDLVHEREVIRNDILDIDQMIIEKRIVVRRLKRVLNINTPDIMTSQEKAPKRSHRSVNDSQYVELI
jgi:enhancer of polycomb-like protein